MALGTRALNDTKKEFGDSISEHLAAIDKWAMDSLNLRCQLIQKTPNYFEYSQQEIDDLWHHSYKKHLLKAGLRLGVIIDKVLTLSSAKQLRKGSGAAIKDDVVGIKARDGGDDGIGAPQMMMLNLAVFSVIVVRSFFIFIIILSSFIHSVFWVFNIS